MNRIHRVAAVGWALALMNPIAVAVAELVVRPKQ